MKLIKPIIDLFRRVSGLTGQQVGSGFEDLITKPSFLIQSHLMFWFLLAFSIIWFCIFYFAYKPKIRRISAVAFFNMGYFIISGLMVGFYLVITLFNYFVDPSSAVYLSHNIPSLIFGIVLIIIMVMLYQFIISAILWVIFVFLFSLFIPNVRAMRKYPISGVR